MNTTGSAAGLAEAARMIATVSRMVRPLRRARFSGTSRTPHRPGIGSGVSGQGPGTNRVGATGRGSLAGAGTAPLGVGASTARKAIPAARNAAPVRAFRTRRRADRYRVRRRTNLPLP
ncbi:hypothetical protein ABT121_05165 [Streptomyces sp. NPDC001928]|uniref:hypothetical protein n=1 Tax=Streptomyces sp. NPDC001928 TaxID=3154404 RepID=UPI003320ABDA